MQIRHTPHPLHPNFIDNAPSLFTKSTAVIKIYESRYQWRRWEDQAKWRYKAFMEIHPDTIEPVEQCHIKYLALLLCKNLSRLIPAKDE